MNLARRDRHSPPKISSRDFTEAELNTIQIFESGLLAPNTSFIVRIGIVEWEKPQSWFTDYYLILVFAARTPIISHFYL